MHPGILRAHFSVRRSCLLIRTLFTHCAQSQQRTIGFLYHWFSSSQLHRFFKNVNDCLTRDYWHRSESVECRNPRRPIVRNSILWHDSIQRILGKCCEKQGKKSGKCQENSLILIVSCMLYKQLSEPKNYLLLDFSHSGNLCCHGP